MCFCDGLDYLIVNKINGEKRFIKGDENLVFFKNHYSLPSLFHRLLKKEYVRLNNVLYQILYNNHPECQRVKMALVKMEELKNPDYGEYALTNTGICYTMKDNKVH